MSTKTGKKNHFDAEIDLIDSDLASFGDDVFRSPPDCELITKYVYRRYQRASLTGIVSELLDAESALDDAIRLLGPADDLCYLKANIDLKLHRLGAVKEDIKNARSLSGTIEARELLADVYFQEGKYDLARESLESLMADSPSWANYCRMAYFRFKMGETDLAEELYVKAGDELTAKQMRHYAWVQLQRGVLDVRRGRYADAAAHYEVAEKAYSGYWLTADHMAEVLAASGEFDKAVKLYESVVKRVPRPDFQQVLGELYVRAGREDLAESCFESAMKGFLESVEKGDVHYLHHLTDFMAHVRRDGVEAEKWARLDIDLRRNFSTLEALAGALKLQGRYTEALTVITEALSSGAEDAHLFIGAADIFEKNGDIENSGAYAQKAREINPNFNAFHFHR